MGDPPQSVLPLLMCSTCPSAMRGVAAQLLAARCGLSRRPRRRVAPLGVQQLEARGP